MMEAAAGGHDSTVMVLLEAGTPWNAIDKEGNCAGDLAVAAGHDSTAEILLEAGKAFPARDHTCQQQFLHLCLCPPVP